MKRFADEEIIRWIVKRVCRFGEVRRADLLEAFPEIGRTVASQLLTKAVQTQNRLIYRDGYKLVKMPVTDSPPYTNDGQLSREIIESGSDLSVTGLNITVRHTLTVPCIPLQKGALQLIASRMELELPIRIFYVGLKLGDEGRYRTVFPQSFEVHGEELYLIANDLEIKEKLLKTFHVSRIVSAEGVKRRRPSHLPGLKGDDEEIRHKATINPLATGAQEMVIKHQLGLNKNDQVLLARRYIRDFRRRACAREETDQQIVWPLIRKLEEM